MCWEEEFEYRITSIAIWRLGGCWIARWNVLHISLSTNEKRKIGFDMKPIKRSTAYQ